MAEDNKYAVRLVHPSNRLNRVVFEVSPDMSETRNVNYKSVDPVHAPGQIYMYGGTSSRTFQISAAKLLSRTPEEADNTLKKVMRLRAWTMPYFGKRPGSFETRNALSGLSPDDYKLATEGIDTTDTGIVAPSDAIDMLGAPPPVLHLSAYSGGDYDRYDQLRNIPVVISQLTIPWPSDVDYIPSTSGVPVPTILSVDVQLNETHSAKEYENFNLTDYRNGVLGGF